MFTFAKLMFRFELAGPVTNRYALFNIKRFFPKFSSTYPNNSHIEREAREKIFGQTLTQDQSALKRFQKPPLPFAFTLPVLPLNHKGSLTCDIELVMAGITLNYSDWVIRGVVSSVSQLAIEQGFKSNIISITSEALDGSGHHISPDNPELTLLSGDNFITTCTDAAETVRVTLRTPLYQNHNGKPLHCMTFPQFIRPIMRKISSLAYYYGGVELDMDFKWLAEGSFAVGVSEDRLRWESWPNAGSGLVGSMIFSGPLLEYLPFLLMGEQFHIGKKAAYGMGAYTINW